MYPEISFIVPGEPAGKGRHRASVVAGHVHTYTPAATANYENLIKLCFMDALIEAGIKWELNGEYAVTVIAYFSIPKSKPKTWKILAAEKVIRPTKKPDNDNILKSVCDALNGIAWRDDSHVADTRVRKVYTDREPMVSVTIVDITDIRNHWVRR